MFGRRPRDERGALYVDAREILPAIEPSDRPELHYDYPSPSEGPGMLLSELLDDLP